MELDIQWSLAWPPPTFESTLELRPRWVPTLEPIREDPAGDWLRLVFHAWLIQIAEQMWERQEREGVARAC